MEGADTRKNVLTRGGSGGRLHKADTVTMAKLQHAVLAGKRVFILRGWDATRVLLALGHRCTYVPGEPSVTYGFIDELDIFLREEIKETYIFRRTEEGNVINN